MAGRPEKPNECEADAQLEAEMRAMIQEDDDHDAEAKRILYERLSEIEVPDSLCPAEIISAHIGMALALAHIPDDQLFHSEVMLRIAAHSRGMSYEDVFVVDLLFTITRQMVEEVVQGRFETNEEWDDFKEYVRGTDWKAWLLEYNFPEMFDNWKKDRFS